MLENLPSEVILTISGYLDFDDKKTLITTCRKLYSLISKINLFSELSLVKYNERANDIIMNHFEQHPHYGKQVKLLNIDMKKLSTNLYLRLSTVFPNVTRVMSPSIAWDFYERDESRSMSPLLQWNKTIETYMLSLDWPSLKFALKNTVFPRLTELMIGHLYEFGDRTDGLDYLYFLPYIKNAPSLRKLELQDCSINIELLEGIHASYPQIQSLKLESSVIVIDEASLPQPIIPANPLSSLKISNISSCDKNGILLDYITSKYRQLQHLELNFEINCSTQLLERLYSGAGFYYNSDDESDEFSTIFELLQKNQKSGLQMYRASGEKFFMNLPKTITSMKMPFYFFDNMVDAFTKSKLEFVKLEFTPDRQGRTQTKPSRTQRDKKFKSLKALTLEFQYAEYALGYVFPASNITKLTLAHFSILYIDSLLSMFPSLEEIHLRHGKKLSSKHDISGRLFPNLLKFTANNCSVDQASFNSLKMMAPNLTSLELRVRFSSFFNVDLSGWTLRFCNISFASTMHNTFRIYNITMQHVTRSIKTNSVNRSVTFLDGHSHLAQQGEQIVSIMCGNNQTIMLNDYFSVFKVNGKIVLG